MINMLVRASLFSAPFLPACNTRILLSSDSIFSQYGRFDKVGHQLELRRDVDGYLFLFCSMITEKSLRSRITHFGGRAGPDPAP